MRSVMRMLAPTPPMGWNSWNTFGGNIDGNLIRESADAFLDQGLRDAGYQYVVIDDHWEAMERDASGRLVPDPDRFPTGIAVLAEYVHSRGLKFGIYSCAGTHTCGGRPASYGNEEIDALTFADWGVDFLKYDFCYKPAGVDGPTLYRRMGQALRASGRRIVFSICNWGGEEVWKWVKRLYDEEKLPTDDNYKFWGENENSYAGHVLTSEEYGDHPKNHGYGRFHALGIVVTIKPLPVYYFKA